MKPIESYVDYLYSLCDTVISQSCVRGFKSHISAALNGEITTKIQEIPIDIRRSKGIFFTSHSLARKVANILFKDGPLQGRIGDPACGGGDLLLACAKMLPLGSDLSSTIKLWGDRLIGFDIQAEFIMATKARLTLMAIERCHSSGLRLTPFYGNPFPFIQQRDFLHSPKLIKQATSIVFNPPFQKMEAPLDCSWSNGGITAASLFLDTCLNSIAQGSQIIAILPDVLRSGSAYKVWRNHIDSNSLRRNIDIVGQFDPWTDVDVFILHLTKGFANNHNHKPWHGLCQNNTTIVVNSQFDVHVGSVVPHRNIGDGPIVPYLHAKTLPRWKIVKSLPERIRFNGTLFKPPFIVVRRTSRPGEKRAIGTIIAGNRKVAVENHLVVLIPKDGKMARCLELLDQLRKDETDRWLDKRIRCRHLTVGALADLPIGRTER